MRGSQKSISASYEDQGPLSAGVSRDMPAAKAEEEIRWISLRRAAELLDVSEATLWRWVKSRPGFPQPVKLSPGCTRLNLAALGRYIASQSAAT
jgi:prophage regulatory protein